MKTTTFLDGVVKDAMQLFSYYRNGPIEMHKLQPGFIFQRCVDSILDKRGIAHVERGLGDHCLPDLGMALQLKTTTQEDPADQFVFCRSSVSNAHPDVQKHLRCKDVENRIFDMYGESATHQFVLVAVNLTTQTHVPYLLHDGEGVVGHWLNAENVSSPHKQTHFFVRTSKLVQLV